MPSEQLAMIFPPRDLTEARFRDFVAANPHVVWALEARALQLYRAGATWIGVKHLCEQLRSDPDVETTGRPWKINNSFTSLLARELINRHPELGAVIELRSRRKLA